MDSKLDQLITQVQDSGCLTFWNHAIRDACGYKRLTASTISKIVAQLMDHDVAFGSSLTPCQEDCVILYDSRPNGRSRQLMASIGRIVTGKGICGDDQVFRAALSAAFPPSRARMHE